MGPCVKFHAADGKIGQLLDGYTGRAYRQMGGSVVYDLALQAMASDPSDEICFQYRRYVRTYVACISFFT